MPRRNKDDPFEMDVSNLMEEKPASKKIKLEEGIEIEESEKDSLIGSDYITESDVSLSLSLSLESFTKDINRVIKRVDPDPEYDDDSVLLSWYDSDLNLVIDEKTFSAACPVQWRGFCFLQAGVRATHGFRTGRVCFEVKITGLCELKYPKGHLNTHLIRIGWSPMNSSLALGSDFKSFGYDSNGRASTKGEIKDYGNPLTVGDVVGAYLDLNANPAVLTFSVNGEDQGIAYEMEHSEENNEPMFPHILTKNMAFECNFGGEKPWFAPKKGFTFVDDMPLKQRIPGPRPPKRKADCEVIMLVGLPKSGKSSWAQAMLEQHPGKYYIIDVLNLVDKMEITDPERKVMILRKARVLGKLLQISKTRCRNYILDQVNGTRSGQQWKMKLFKKFQRRAVVFVIPDAELQQRLENDPRGELIYLMRGKFSLPEPSFLLNRIEYVELPQFEAEKIVEEYKRDTWYPDFTEQKFMDPCSIFNRRGKKKFFQQKLNLLQRRKFADSVGEASRTGRISPHMNQDWQSSYWKLPHVGWNAPQRDVFGEGPSKNRNNLMNVRGRSPGSWENNQMQNRRSMTPLGGELEFRDSEHGPPRSADNWPTTNRPHGRAASLSPPRSITSKRMFSPELRARRDFHEEQFRSVDRISCTASHSSNYYQFEGGIPGNRKRKRSFSPHRDAGDNTVEPRNRKLNYPDFLHRQEDSQNLLKGRVEHDLPPRKRSSSFSPDRGFFSQQGSNLDNRYAQRRSHSFQSDVDFPPHAYHDGSEVRMSSGFPPNKEMHDLLPDGNRICRDSYPPVEERNPGDFSSGEYRVDVGISSEKVRHRSPIPIQQGRNLTSFQKSGCGDGFPSFNNESRNFRFHEAKISDFHEKEMEVSDGPIREQEMIAIRDRFHDPRSHGLPMHETRRDVDSVTPRKSRGNLLSHGIEASSSPSRRSDVNRPSAPWEERQGCGWLRSEVGLFAGNLPMRNENAERNSVFPIPGRIEGESYHNRRHGSSSQSASNNWHSHTPNEFPSISQNQSRSPDSRDAIHYSRNFNTCLPPSSMPRGFSPMSQNNSLGGINNVSVNEGFRGHSRGDPDRSLRHGSRSPVQNIGKSPVRSPQRYGYGNRPEHERNLKGLSESFNKESTGHISRSPVRSIRRSSRQDCRGSPRHNSRTSSSRGLRESPVQDYRESLSRDDRHLHGVHLRELPCRDPRGSPCRDHRRSPSYGSKSSEVGVRRSGRATRWSSPIRETIETPEQRRKSPFGEISFKREPEDPPIHCKRDSPNRNTRRSLNWNPRASSDMERMQSPRGFEVEVSKEGLLHDSRTSVIHRNSVCQEGSHINYCAPHNEPDGRLTPNDLWQMGNWTSHQPQNKIGPSAGGIYHSTQEGLDPSNNSSHPNMQKPLSSRGRFLQREEKIGHRLPMDLKDRKEFHLNQQRSIRDNFKGRFPSDNKPSLNAEDGRPQRLQGRLGPKVSDEDPTVPKSRMNVPEIPGSSQSLRDYHRNRQSPRCGDINDSQWEREVLLEFTEPEIQTNPDHEELAPYEQPFDQEVWDSNNPQAALKPNDRESRRNINMELPGNRAIRPPDRENRGNIWTRVGGYVDDERELRKGPFNRRKEAVPFKDCPSFPRDRASPRRLSKGHQAKISNRIGRRSPVRRVSPRKSHLESERFTSRSKDKSSVRGHWKSPPRRRNARW